MVMARMPFIETWPDDAPPIGDVVAVEWFSRCPDCGSDYTADNHAVYNPKHTDEPFICRLCRGEQ
jgi:hypothetical protein